MQKVICIDDTFPPAIAAQYSALPEYGKTYHIRKEFNGRTPANKTDDGVLLVELVNPPDLDRGIGFELGFARRRFVDPADFYQEEAVSETQSVPLLFPGINP